MSWIFGEEKDPHDILNTKFISEKITKNNRSYTKWITPYGVSFGDPYGNSNDFYFYEYDKDLDEKRGQGCLSGNDIITSIQQLEKNPNKLRTKPQSIIRLEEATGQKAFRMENAFGKWHIRTNDYSMFNNPFGCSLGYSDTENDFEFYWLHGNEDPLERVPVDKIIILLKSKGYIE